MTPDLMRLWHSLDGALLNLEAVEEEVEAVASSPHRVSFRLHLMVATRAVRVLQRIAKPVLEKAGLPTGGETG